MSVGTTADFALTRNDIIASALRKVRGWPEDGNPPTHRIREAIRALNLIVRTEDLKQTDLSKSLWAYSTTYLDLAVKRAIYSSSQSLPEIRELDTVLVRDTSGGDVPLDIISPSAYASLAQKNDTGVPSKVYLKEARLRTSNTLFINPVPSSVTAGDSVTVSNVLYTCILGHTSSTENKPATGASYSLYWRNDGAHVAADDWATATDYSNGDLLVLHYKRPLYDFDLQYDNPDFPLGWEDYFIYKLAIRLAPEYDLGMDRRQELKNDLAQISAEIFPSTRQKTNTYHNKTCFF